MIHGSCVSVYRSVTITKRIDIGHYLMYTYNAGVACIQQTCLIYGMCDGGGFISFADECGIHFFPFYLCAKICRYVCMTQHTLSLSAHASYPFFIEPKWRRRQRWSKVRVKYFMNEWNAMLQEAQSSEYFFSKRLTVCGWFDSHLLSSRDNISNGCKNWAITDRNGNHCA